MSPTTHPPSSVMNSVIVTDGLLTLFYGDKLSLVNRSYLLGEVTSRLVRHGVIYRNAVVMLRGPELSDAETDRYFGEKRELVHQITNLVLPSFFERYIVDDRYLDVMDEIEEILDRSVST
jgi:hypothetical protein